MLSPRLGSGLQSGSRSEYRSGSGSSSPATSRTASPLSAQLSASSASGSSSGATAPLSPSVGLRNTEQRGCDSPLRSPGPHHKAIANVSKTDIKSKLNTKAVTVPPCHPSCQAGQGSCGPVPQVTPYQSLSDVARKKSHPHH